MAKAVGIGGVFLHFKGEESKVMNWYNEYLGLSLSPYGSGFTEGEQLVLLSFKRSDDDTPLLNLRVDDINILFNNFKDNGVRIVKDVTSYNYGKFGTFQDPFGNIIELWEPVVDVYKDMVRSEILKFKKENSK
jgi:uncharacterized glyoxalase superfamily protein PhnB